MNRRGFLKSLATLVGVGLVAPKILLETSDISSQLSWADDTRTKPSNILGYKGRTPHDVGYFYCPYIPMQVSQTTPTTKVSFHTRYDKSLS